MPNDEQHAYLTAQAAQQKAVLARRRRLARAGRAPKPRPARSGASPRQEIGFRAEREARLHLESRGATLLGRNLRCKAGEIDLIFHDQGTLAFVEVRKRASERFGGAAASVNRRKQLRLVRAARFFLPALVQRHFGGCVPACRFDVVTIDTHGITWH
jgi:putative endonuclease